MFDFGFSELLLIAVVALVVLGPERLPKAARFVGLWVRRARAQWYSVKSELERELAAEDLKRDMQDAQAAMRDLETSMRTSGEDARREFEAMREQTVDGLDPRAPRSRGDAAPDADAAVDEAPPDPPPTAVTPTDSRDGDAPAPIADGDPTDPLADPERKDAARDGQQR